jgi:hypothetical protein
MPYTARDYGLVVNGYLDERRDYYKSTHAAARYLLVLYRQLHDWLLVMAAYNGGPGECMMPLKKAAAKIFGIFNTIFRQNPGLMLNVLLPPIILWKVREA